MANYKLTNDYWETSGIYDITQGKTQREINAAVAANTGANDPSVAEKTVTGDIATFDGVDGVPLKNLTVNIEPVQDLHGYANPYPAGGGKNIMIAVSEGETVNDVTFTILDDGTVTANGTASSAATFVCGTFTGTSGTTIRMRGLTSTGSNTTYSMQLLSGSSVIAVLESTDYVQYTPQNDGTFIVRIVIRQDYAANNLLFRPMITLTSDDSSTFVPSANICPITGWTGANVTRTGKNLYPYQTIAAYTWGFSQYYDLADAVNPIFLKAGITYTLTIDADKKLYRIRLWDSDGNMLLNYNNVPTIVSGTSNGFTYFYNYKFYSLANTSNANNIYVITPQIDTWMDMTIESTASTNNQLEVGSSSSTYEAYSGTTIPITFPDAAGTVYGGTLDVTNGVLTVDREMWSGTIADGTVQVTSNNYIRYQFYPTITHSPKQAGISTGKISNLCKYYYEDNYTYPHWYNNAYGTVQLFVPESVESSTPVQFVISLATPITYTLTPIEVKALLGQNNIWADCGDVDVEYGAYLTVVENQLGEKIPKVAVAPIEKTTTASKAYAVNEMFFMGDKLYIATSSIASGATFTVGTNCDETTLGEQIAALLNA